MKKIVIFITLFIIILAGLGLKNTHHFKKLFQASSTNSIEKTFAIIKPDAVKAQNSGKIIDLIEHNGFDIVRLQKITLDKNQAQQFYAVHKDRPFFNDLITFMTSDPIIIMVLQKDNAVKAWRDLMGATDPSKADEGTIRKLFGTDITHNASHGSDSQENARSEITQFFPEI
jgi:nucleoside-diphosphate kinase